jgi:hypothetical protein
MQTALKIFANDRSNRNSRNNNSVNLVIVIADGTVALVTSETHGRRK